MKIQTAAPSVQGCRQVNICGVN